MEWMWHDVGVSSALARKIPLRWTSGTALEVAASLRSHGVGKKAQKAVLLRIQAGGEQSAEAGVGNMNSSALLREEREFRCAIEAAAWIEETETAQDEQAVEGAREAGEEAVVPGMSACIGVSGWLAGKKDSVQRHWRFLPVDLTGTELHALLWESDVLITLGTAMTSMLKSYLVRTHAASPTAT